MFTDATLTAIAQDKPRNERELAAIPGVGRAKLDRYGGEVLVVGSRFVTSTRRLAINSLDSGCGVVLPSTSRRRAPDLLIRVTHDRRGRGGDRSEELPVDDV